MSTTAPCRCRPCGHDFQARWGGGFRYVDRFCRGCGAYRCLRYEEDPRTWTAFLESHRAFQEARGPLRERQRAIAEAARGLEARVQEVLGPCPCGGAYTDERPRCPRCGQEDYELTGEPLVDYD